LVSPGLLQPYTMLLKAINLTWNLGSEYFLMEMKMGIEEHFAFVYYCDNDVCLDGFDM
jgi:hypothetical protein